MSPLTTFHLLICFRPDKRFWCSRERSSLPRWRFIYLAPLRLAVLLYYKPPNMALMFERGRPYGTLLFFGSSPLYLSAQDLAPVCPGVCPAKDSPHNFFLFVRPQMFVGQISSPLAKTRRGVYFLC